MNTLNLPATGTDGRWVMDGEGISDVEALPTDYTAHLLGHLDAVSGLRGFDLAEASGFGEIRFDVTYVCDGCSACDETGEDDHVVYSTIVWVEA